MQITEMDKRWTNRYEDTLRSLDVVNNDHDKRFDVVNERLAAANEDRKQLAIQATHFATHEELAGAIANIQTELHPVADYVNQSRGKGAGINTAWVVLVAFVTLVLGILSIIDRFIH